MALLIPIKDYEDMARQYRGTPASTAIIGLISEVKSLQTTIAWAIERLSVDGAMTAKEQATTKKRLRTAIPPA